MSYKVISKFTRDTLIGVIVWSQVTMSLMRNSIASRMTNAEGIPSRFKASPHGLSKKQTAVQWSI
jgi:hypothetical protein